MSVLLRSARCTSKRPRSWATCGRRGEWQCDWCLTAKHRCRRPLCNTCARKMGSVLHYCSDHDGSNTSWLNRRYDGTMRILVIRGEALPVIHWARSAGVSAALIFGRLFNRWTDRQAVFLPKGSRRPQRPSVDPACLRSFFPVAPRPRAGVRAWPGGTTAC